MAFALALAGSTSKSHVLLCEMSGELLAVDEYKGLHLRGIRQEELTDHIERAISCLAEAADIRLDRFKRQCQRISVALSGMDHRFVPGTLLGSFGELRFAAATEESLIVHGLAEAIHRAILGEKPGLVIRAGTGFSVFAVNRSGDTEIASALTTIMGAPGSAYTLGLGVFHIMKKVLDGVATRGEAAIAQGVLTTWQAENPLDFLERVHAIRMNEGDGSLLNSLSELADIVFDQARIGNVDAGRLIEQVFEYQHTIVSRIIEKLSLAKDSFEVIFHGRLFSSHPEFAERLLASIESRCPGARALDHDREYFAPVVGAGKLALSPVRFTENGQTRRLTETVESLGPSLSSKVLWSPITLPRRAI